MSNPDGPEQRRAEQAEWFAHEMERAYLEVELADYARQDSSTWDLQESV